MSNEHITSLIQAIANRRSLGLTRLKPDVVDKSILTAALEAANWAPSNGDTEPWRFTIFTGESRKQLGEAFAESYKQDAAAKDSFNPTNFEAQKQRALDAPVWISIGVEPAKKDDGTLRMTRDDEIMAVACAVQNLHLVLCAYGLVGMWHSKGLSVHPHVAKFLGFEDPSQLLGLFWCGYPNVPWPAGERGPAADKITWKE